MKINIVPISMYFTLVTFHLYSKFKYLGKVELCRRLLFRGTGVFSISLKWENTNGSLYLVCHRYRAPKASCCVGNAKSSYFNFHCDMFVLYNVLSQ